MSVHPGNVLLCNLAVVVVVHCCVLWLEELSEQVCVCSAWQPIRRQPSSSSLVSACVCVCAHRVVIICISSAVVSEIRHLLLDYFFLILLFQHTTTLPFCTLRTFVVLDFWGDRNSSSSSSLINANIFYGLPASGWLVQCYDSALQTTLLTFSLDDFISGATVRHTVCVTPPTSLELSSRLLLLLSHYLSLCQLSLSV